MKQSLCIEDDRAQVLAAREKWLATPRWRLLASRQAKRSWIGAEVMAARAIALGQEKVVSNHHRRQLEAQDRIVFEWCRRLDLPLMSPPRAPEAIDALGREVERLRAVASGQEDGS